MHDSTDHSLHEEASSLEDITCGNWDVTSLGALAEFYEATENEDGDEHAWCETGSGVDGWDGDIADGDDDGNLQIDGDDDHKSEQSTGVSTTQPQPSNA